MTSQQQKSFNVANMLLGIGILLTIIPLGLSLVMILGIQDDPIQAAQTALGWAFFVVCGLLPLGLALLVGGVSWMVAIKRNAKASDLEADAEEAKDGSGSTESAS